MKLILCKYGRNFSTEQVVPVCIYIRPPNPRPRNGGTGNRVWKDEAWTKLVCAPVTFGFIYKDQRSGPCHGGTAGLKEMCSGEDQTKQEESWHPERQDQEDASEKRKYAHHASSGRASPSASTSGSGADSSWFGISMTTKPSRSVTTASGFNFNNVSINDICTSLHGS
jgi:hypothetical protein